MADKWIILDGNFIGRRCDYGFQGMEFDGEPTGMIFGFLLTIGRLQEQFEAQQVAICFDMGRNKRIDLFPGYKEKRRQKHKEEFLKTKSSPYHTQLRKLWKDLLPAMGYQNILMDYGYEADDWIAKVCQDISVEFPEDEMIIVSADHDLFQLIGPHTSVYNPNSKGLYTLQSFKTQYGVMPSDWVQVKAIAGCSGDEVPGVVGVGEKTALSYLRGEVRMGSKAHIQIRKFLNSKEYVRNLSLVKLPLLGTPDCFPIKHSIDPDKWKAVAASLGMESLVTRGPYTGRRTRVGK